MRCESCRACSRGVTTGTPIQLMIENTDQRSKDYGEIAQAFRPGHADITYHQKYGIRDYRGGGRSSARETAARVAAGGVARAVLAALAPGAADHRLHGADGDAWRSTAAGSIWPRSSGTRSGAPDAVAAAEWAEYLDGLRQVAQLGRRGDRGGGGRRPAGAGRAALWQAGQRSGELR